MQSYIKFFIAIILLLILSSQATFADSISSQTLIENGKSYDNQQIIYEGEVIGDIMRRGDYAWINVTDGSNAMGVWINYSEIKKISHTGNYKYSGDIVRIQGIFHRACAEHGGDMDIHASSLEIIKSGILIIHPVSTYRIFWGLGFMLVSLLLFIFYKRSIRSGAKKEI